MRFVRIAPALLFLSIPAVATIAACSGDPPMGSGGSGGAGGATTSTSHTSTGTVPGTGGDVPLPDTFTVSGIVTDGKAPVEGAIVMQGGGKPAFTTGPDGTFTLAMVNGPGIPTVVAAKIGYRATGFEVYDLPQNDITLVLDIAAPPDNTGYVYGEPGNGDPAHDNNTKVCGHCHTSYVKDFQGSGHHDATRDPLVQALYAGVSAAYPDQASCESAGGAWRTGLVPGTKSDTAKKCYVGAGVLPSLNPSCGGAGQLACDDPALPAAAKPTAFGRCADCHGAGIDGIAGGRNLLDAVGYAYESGNHCDVCHHVRDVDLTKPPGIAGALILQRPSEKVSMMPNALPLPVFFGPEPDVPNGYMRGSYQPKFRASVFCGGCHEQKQEALVPGTSLDPVRWPEGLPTLSTYSEWAESAYQGTGATCQFCHMPPDDHGLTNSVDTSSPDLAGMTGGFPRTSDRLRKHTFRSPVDGSPRLFDGAVTLDLHAAPAGSTLAVTAKVKNFGAGHAIPTGEPMRALLLVVRASACGVELSPSGGMTIDDWGGARASAVVGAGATVNGAEISWAGAGAKIGAVVRAVRPTGTYDDYPGVGRFADPTLTAPEKGIEIHAPVGEATITSVSGSTITLSHAIAAQDGDVLYVADAAAWPPIDGSASPAIAGSAGYSFARTLVDPNGARGVPHFRAVDMTSDNRLPPGATATTTHTFTMPPSCATVSVDAAVLYRPVPLALALARGVPAHDYVVATASTSAALP
ncbi:Cytochrome c family protein [Minicystis rosea]|nr:Cytochrome c family protein [Minicystis rosea]